MLIDNGGAVCNYTTCRNQLLLYFVLFELLLYLLLVTLPDYGSLELAIALVAEAAELMYLLLTGQVIRDVVRDSQRENGVPAQRVAQSVYSHYRKRIDRRF
jgi:hypothetical protein